MKDYYKILELEFGVDIITVKKAYRRLALKYHPVKNKEPYATQKFIEITEAYNFLKDPLIKNEYDRLYQANFRTNTQKQYSEQSYHQTYQQKQHEGDDFGTEKAKEYSSTHFKESAKRLLKEIIVGAIYIPNVIAIILVGLFAIHLLTKLPIIFKDDVGLGLTLLPLVPGLGYLTYRLFLVAQSDYKEERKRKILKNK